MQRCCPPALFLGTHRCAAGRSNELGSLLRAVDQSLASENPVRRAALLLSLVDVSAKLGARFTPRRTLLAIHEEGLAGRLGTIPTSALCDLLWGAVKLSLGPDFSALLQWVGEELVRRQSEGGFQDLKPFHLAKASWAAARLQPHLSQALVHAVLDSVQQELAANPALFIRLG